VEFYYAKFAVLRNMLRRYTGYIGPASPTFDPKVGMVPALVSCIMANETAFYHGYQDYQAGEQSLYFMHPRRPEAFKRSTINGLRSPLKTDVEREYAAAYIEGFMKAESDNHE
jgi:hypothetical protein